MSERRFARRARTLKAAALVAGTSLLISACATTTDGTASRSSGAAGLTVDAPAASGNDTAEIATTGAPADPSADTAPGQPTTENNQPDHNSAGGTATNTVGTPPSTIDGQPLGGADTTWDVELADNATVIGFDTIATALVDFDSDAGRWTFQPDAVAHLQPGTVIIVAGQGIGRIESIEQTPQGSVISTSDASLADVIDTGTVAWDATVNWDASWIVGDQPQEDGFRAPGTATAPTLVKLAGLAMVDERGNTSDIYATRSADGGINWTYSQDGNTYTFKIIPSGGSMSVVIQVAREGLTYTAQGTVGSADNSGQANYSGGQLSSATIDTSGMNTNLTLSIAAAGSGAGKEFSFPIPGLIFKYPIMVGPVLVTIGMTAQLVGSFHVPASGSATFQSDFSYSADGGFSYNGSTITPQGQLGSFVMNPEGADPAGFIGEYVDVQFGVAFPRVSATLFGSGPSAWIQPGILLGTSLTWGPVCKTAYIRGELQGGYDFTLLGVKLAGDKTTLWDQRRDTKGDSCE